MSAPTSITRREWLARALASATALALGAEHALAATVSAPPTLVTVHKDKSCSCCEKWVSHMRASGFRVVVRDEPNIDAVKDQLGVPADLRSCHTARVGGYLIEGHVPASDVRRVVATKPKIVGLTVPGMPSGTPGMEGPKGPEHYEVLSFDARGKTRVFAKH